MYGVVANGSLSLTSPFTFEIRGLMHVAVDVVTDVGDGIGGSQSFRTLVHSESLCLKGLLEGSNASHNLSGLGVVGAEILHFAL